MNYSDSVRIRYVLTYGLPYKFHSSNTLNQNHYSYGLLTPRNTQLEAIDNAIDDTVKEPTDNYALENAGLKIVRQAKCCCADHQSDVIVSVEVA